MSINSKTGDINFTRFMIILVTWFSNASGGGEQSTIELCNTLSAQSEVDAVILLYAYSCPQARKLVDTYLDQNVARYTVRVPLSLWRTLAFFYVAYICMVWRPSIVQINFRATFAESLAARMFGRRVVACLRIIPFHQKQLRQYFLVDHIICISHAVYNNLLRLGWSKQATVIYNGVNINRFFLDTQSSVSKSDHFYVLSRLIPWKRPDWFVHAAAIVHAKFPNTRFYIFGDGPMNKSLETLIANYNLTSVIHLRGWTNPNDYIVRQCGIFVLPSYEEPFGRSLVEAVLQTKVIVASCSGAVPELLPSYDLLFAPDNLNELANSMIRATINYSVYQHHTQEIRDRFADKFNLDRVVSDYLRLYNKLLA